VPFPAVTFCPPDNGKWMVLVKTIEKLATMEQMLKLVKTLPSDFTTKIAGMFTTANGILFQSLYPKDLLGQATLDINGTFESAIDLDHRPLKLYEIELAYMLNYAIFSTILFNDINHHNDMLRKLEHTIFNLTVDNRLTTGIQDLEGNLVPEPLGYRPFGYPPFRLI
jgi:hypothetical protein